MNSKNIERAEMRCLLEEKKSHAARLRLTAEGSCANIRKLLNTALTPVDDLDIPATSEQMDKLIAVWGELQATLSNIDRLEEELF